ncbi:GNAT family N-acetyltransferase [Bacillus sp. Marseille-P3661]|uniref:GNAT family N-acetyltransferase n=1 Tax=Bacillus sp. Marseille-P3661 TaxID=1936234 RepID=UPI000C8498C1|nr:GNAT family N-acetyltransferase [Bacillus sp. Marseille-P3661]
MITRDFEGKDLEVCAELFIEVFNNEPWNDRWTFPLAMNYFNDIINTPGFNGFILEDTDGVKGFVFGTRKKWWSGDVYYLYEMCVQPTNHRTGLGSRLMDDVKKILTRYQYSSVILSTERTYIAARFYEKQGFIESENTRFYYYGL